ncbi:MAG TPA: hypothetical protein VHC47_06435 [Mucilaginibacter sp.]|nr:hypothetical protein [Mucilaginibacter sp.]
MGKFWKRAAAALTAVVLAVISDKFITGWYNLIPWGIAAFIIGYISKDRPTGIINAAIFGYVLSLVYIYLGYSGKTDSGSMIHFILFDVFVSLLGAVAGIICAFAGSRLRIVLTK